MERQSRAPTGNLNFVLSLGLTYIDMSCLHVWDGKTTVFLLTRVSKLMPAYRYNSLWSEGHPKKCNMTLIYHTWYEIKPEKLKAHEWVVKEFDPPDPRLLLKSSNTELHVKGEEETPGDRGIERLRRKARGGWWWRLQRRKKRKLEKREGSVHRGVITG